MIFSFWIVGFEALLWKQLINIIKTTSNSQWLTTKPFFTPQKSVNQLWFHWTWLRKTMFGFILQFEFKPALCVFFFFLLYLDQGLSGAIFFTAQEGKQTMQACLEVLIKSLLLTLHWLKQVFWLNPTSLAQVSMFHPQCRPCTSLYMAKKMNVYF